MVSPYLLRPLRSLEEVLSGARARPAGNASRRSQGERRIGTGAATEVGTARGAREAYEARGATPLWPRLVWTNTKRQSRRPKG